MNCRYIYDEDGLRWEEADTAVTLLVAGEPKHFRPVRNGSGMSRIARFIEKQQPHPTIDGAYLFGEITEKDLGRITENGYIEVLIDGARVRIENVDSETSTFVAQVRAAGTGLTRTLRAGRLGGSGRVENFETLAQALTDLNALTPGTGDAAAVAQLLSMPKSARAGAKAARTRLRAVTEHLTQRGMTASLLDAIEQNPDAILHLTPETHAVLVAAEPRAAERLEQAARDERGRTTREQLVLSACRLAAGAGTDQERSALAAALTSEGELAREALELLARHRSTRQLAAELLLEAARTQPGRVLTFETAFMLTTAAADAPTELSALDHLLQADPRALAYSWSFLEALGGKKDLVLANAPLQIAAMRSAPKDVRDAAVGRLLAALGAGEIRLAAEALRRIEDIHPEHAKTVCAAVNALGLQTEPSVAARLDLARRAWNDQQEASAEQHGRDDERRRRVVTAVSELENGIRERMSDLQKNVSNTTRLLLEASEEARRFAASARMGLGHQRESVHLRGLLGDISRHAHSFGRILADAETATTMLSEECGRIDREHGERAARRLGELTGSLRYVVRETVEQLSSVRCPEYLELETAYALSSRAESVALETGGRVRAAAETLMNAAADVKRTLLTGA